MPFRRSSFKRRSGKPLHPVSWCGHAEIDVLGTVSGVTDTHVLCSESQFESKFTSPTIVRIRGDVHAHLVLNSTAGVIDRLQLWYGIIVADSNIISFPALNTQDGQERPWLYLRYVALVADNIPQAASTSAGAFGAEQIRSGGRPVFRDTIDVKAMRRVPGGARLLLVKTFIQAGGTPNLRFGVQVRALIKE